MSIVEIETLFDMHEGVAKALRVTVKNPAGEVIPLTGVQEIIVKLAESEDGPALITKQLTDGIQLVESDTKFEVSLSGSDSVGLDGLHYLEAYVKDALGNDAIVLDGYVNLKKSLIK